MQHCFLQFFQNLIILSMINSYSDYIFYLSEDIKQINKGSKLSLIQMIIHRIYNDDLICAYLYCRSLRRLEYALNVLKKRGGVIGNLIFLYCKMRHRHYAMKYHVSLKPNVAGYGLCISHISMGGCVLNAEKIGNYFSVRQFTTIGNGKNGKPIIGNKVIFGANSCAIGDISIGDNAIIGAGSVVTKDVPSNAIVAGNPANLLHIRNI